MAFDPARRYRAAARGHRVAVDGAETTHGRLTPGPAGVALIWFYGDGGNIFGT